MKKAAGALRQALQRDALRQQGYTWIDLEQYEHEVNVLQRFLVDTSVSGGALPHLLGKCTKPELLDTLDVLKSVQQHLLHSSTLGLEVCCLPQVCSVGYLRTFVNPNI